MTDLSGGVVHVVDDDAAIRDSLLFLLNSAGFAARVCDGASALLARVGALEPGCIVTDVRMPGMSGLELLARLRELGLAHPVIVLTGHADVSLAIDAMKAGAFDFLEKPFDDDALLGAVRSALAAGEGEFDRHAERAEVERRVTSLTDRERDVFEAIVAGDSNKAAALRLGISPRTVEIYRANVMEKMGTKSLSELVRLALLHQQR